jgi:uncharacterized membrane protein YfhO
VESTGSLRRQRGWEIESGSVRLLNRDTGSLALSAKLPAEGLLVVFESFEKGWHATVDGRPAPISRTDGAFLGVRLGRGNHVVQFNYRPRGLLEGMGLAGIGLLGLVATTKSTAPAGKRGKREAT